MTNGQGPGHPIHPHPLVLVPLALAGLTAWLVVSTPVPWTIAYPWVPSLSVDLAFRIDGLALLMLALVSGIGLAVFTYAAAYMNDAAERSRLLALLTAFMLAMTGAVTTDNLVVLFLFWELTSVTSFLLVGFKHDYEPNRRAARQALLITAGGGLVLLAGVLLLGAIFGTYSIQAVIARAPNLAAHPLLPAALACVFVGAFSKSAQWPFHFWLPNAMAAPTPVSAYLHSATMVKLGVYLLARLNPAFERLFLWEVTLVSVGAITALWAMVLAMRERDLKRILAWSTVSSLGTLVLLIGLPGPGAAEATAAFLLAHALYKAPLFFVAGNVDHSTGTRSIDRLAGMAREMPWTAATALLAGLSMAGVPLSFGYVAKDFIAIAKTEGLSFEWVSYATMVAGAISVAVASVAAIRVFWHRGGQTLPADIHEASFGLLAPPLAVASVGIVLGMAPALALPLVQAAASAITSTTRSGAAPLAPGASGMPTTLLVFALGLVIFVGWDRLHVWMEALRWFDRFGLAVFYARSLKRIPTVAGVVTTRLQPGRLPAYLALIIGVVAIATTGAMAAGPALAWPAWSAPPPAVIGATALIIGASIAACRIRDPFVLLLVTGLAGLGSAVIALFAGAPDVAFTQFAVEVAFVVVVAAVLLRVRACAPPPDPAGRAGRRTVAALVMGALVAVLTLAAAAGPGHPALPQYFGERAFPDAHGRNVANVIIVDFRALDTLGELAVVAFTFVGILPLLHWLRSVGRPDPGGPMTRRAVLLDVVVRTLYPGMLLFSVWLLLRGHNEPGGGFIGGLVAVAATALRAAATSSVGAARRIPLGPLRLAGAGVGLALVSGLPALLAGRPYLTHLWVDVPLVVTSVSVSTVLLFDLGVYLSVWGALGGVAAHLIGLDEEDAA